MVLAAPIVIVKCWPPHVPIIPSFADCRGARERGADSRAGTTAVSPAVWTPETAFGAGPVGDLSVQASGSNATTARAKNFRRPMTSSEKLQPITTYYSIGLRQYWVTPSRRIR